MGHHDKMELLVPFLTSRIVMHNNYLVIVNFKLLKT